MSAILGFMMQESSTEQRRAVGERLRLLRIAICGSHHGAQKLFAERVGIEPNTWNMYERGNSRIELDKALQLCRKVGVSLDWIYFGIDSLLPVHIARALEKAAQDHPPATTGGDAPDPPHTSPKN